MRVELICIGSELLEGKPNTNISYIGEKLFNLGFELSRVSVVSDSKREISKVFKDAIDRSDIIISTGGLGPTFDDLTSETVAELLSRKRFLDREVLVRIQKKFAEKNLEMPRVNEKQAYIIEGAQVIENPVGTAPGQVIKLSINNSEKTIFLLPGPPRELYQMFENDVIPRLKKYGGRLKKTLTIHIFGLSESEVEEKIQRIISDESVVDKGLVSFIILVHHHIVDIKITATGTDELLIDETLHNLKKEFEDVLSDYIYGYDAETLESVIGKLLLERKLSLAVAESCTAGMLSSRITNVSGSSLYFKEGFVVYSNDSKIKRLGVKPETIENFGAVSKETAAEMLDGLKRNTSAHCGISITGIAGPHTSSGKPIGLTYIGVQTPLSKVINEFRFSGSRNEIREKSVLTALDMLRKELLKFR